MILHIMEFSVNEPQHEAGYRVVHIIISITDSKPSENASKQYYFITQKSITLAPHGFVTKTYVLGGHSP